MKTPKATSRRNTFRALSRVLLTLPAVGFLAFAPAQAKGESGSTRGGGTVVVRNNQAVYADEAMNCQGDWDRGAKRLQQMAPEFESVMKALEETHWYFAFLIRDELAKIKVCYTESRLMQPSGKPSTLFVYDGVLIAYRIDNELIVSTSSWDEAKNKGLKNHSILPIHEALHGFIPAPSHVAHSGSIPDEIRTKEYYLQDELRMRKLYTVANAIFRNSQNRYSREGFAQVIQDNDVRIVPPAMGELDRVSAEILTALDGSASARARRAAAGAVRASRLSLKKLRSMDAWTIDQLGKALDLDLLQAAKASDYVSVRTLLAEGALSAAMSSQEQEPWSNGMLSASVELGDHQLFSLLIEKWKYSPTACLRLKNYKAERSWREGTIYTPQGLLQDCAMQDGLWAAIATASRSGKTEFLRSLLEVQGFEAYGPLDAAERDRHSLVCVLAASGNAGSVQEVASWAAKNSVKLTGWNSHCPTERSEGPLPMTLALSGNGDLNFLSALRALESRSDRPELKVTHAKDLIKAVFGNPDGERARIVFDSIGTDLKGEAWLTLELWQNAVERLQSSPQSPRYDGTASLIPVTIAALKKVGALSVEAGRVPFKPVFEFADKGPFDPAIAGALLDLEPQALRERNQSGESLLSIYARRIVEAEGEKGSPNAPIWRGAAKEQMLSFLISRGVTRADTVETRAALGRLSSRLEERLKEKKRYTYPIRADIESLQRQVSRCSELAGFLKIEGKKLR